MSSKKVFLLAIAISIIGAYNYRKNATASSDTGHDSLNSLCEKFKTDKCNGPGGHGYVEVYELFFYPIRNVAKKIAEIGIETGSSLHLWREYFPHATIYGIDIDDKSNLDSERIKTFVGDQSKKEDLQKFITKYGSNFDFILDDGGHSMEQQQISLGFLFKHVKPGGYYIIEDLQTSLWRKYGAEPDESNTTLTMIQNFMKTRYINSKYLTNEEIEYLNKTIAYCNLLYRNDTFYKNSPVASITCILKKKDS
jgi:hypothetical protein